MKSPFFLIDSQYVPTLMYCMLIERHNDFDLSSMVYFSTLSLAAVAPIY